MRLAEFIVATVDRIVDEWEAFAMTIRPAADSMNRAELRDHARSILLAAARDMNTEQSEMERAAKSMGEGPEKTPSLDVAAASHGELRHQVGFDLVQMTSEFRHLRASVIRLWTDSLTQMELLHMRDLIRFNEAIDEALAESTAAYAEQVNHSRDIFLAILGHDLRAPLQAVSMSSELLAGRPGLDEKGRSHVQRIRNSTRHMAGMVNDLLEFVRSRLGNSLPIVRTPISMALLCQAAIDEASAGQPLSDLRYEAMGETEGEWDQGRIEQLLQNLIGNALQHGASNLPITLRLIGEPDSVTLTLHNHGEPIAESAISTLFFPLVRSTSDRAGETSLGLGLFIVNEVVIAHGGSVQVISNEAEGTTFTVMLPKR
ncbi:sensor histidine kinase [Pseudomonas turukhanskensis]|uniref:histidine kinase n=1 Tax=Pseudomonas turukhanskensis TaxID=1806536 RepID=A0A9W6K9A9_9PSED|nr:HAMP domain-containing sensor histidine kinase [Pseudomonas turukhanskensis]GLK91920.1 two-component sensor histidine kinase [Pseudomonas turukhanskensis]